MPLRHGSKIYCQLLLDANRYKLAETLADKQGKKVTALLRGYVYGALQQEMPEIYKIAEEADVEKWNESVRRRVEGRMRSKQEKKPQE